MGTPNGWASIFHEMMPQPIYLLDSDVLITAKNQYYAFDLCPGFWQCVLHHHREGRVFSIARVRRELLAGGEDALVRWVKDSVPDDFFKSETEAEIRVFDEIMEWVEGRDPRWSASAKEEFALGADGWLVACGRFLGATVVTNERSAPESRRKVKLPDVCDRFEVPCLDAFNWLRRLKARFDWIG